jgi:hypothetical protein
MGKTGKGKINKRDILFNKPTAVSYSSSKASATKKKAGGK